MLSQEATKRFVAFQGFALCVRVCREISRERALGYSPPPPSAPAWWQAEKSQMTKSPPLAVKKVRLTPVQKKITLFSIGRCQTDGMTQSAVFLPPKAAFFTAAGRFLNHAGCCRHAKHGVGDGGDDKEENEFPDWCHRQPQKGEADNSRHGFLCLYQLIT